MRRGLSREKKQFCAEWHGGEGGEEREHRTDWTQKSMCVCSQQRGPRSWSHDGGVLEPSSPREEAAAGLNGNLVGPQGSRGQETSQRWQQKVVEDQVAADQHFRQEHHKNLDRIRHRNLHEASESCRGGWDLRGGETAERARHPLSLLSSECADLKVLAEKLRSQGELLTVLWP